MTKPGWIWGGEDRTTRKDEWGFLRRQWWDKYFIRKDAHPVAFWASVIISAVIMGGGAAALLVISPLLIVSINNDLSPTEETIFAIGLIGAIIFTAILVPVFGSRKDIWPWWWWN